MKKKDLTEAAEKLKKMFPDIYTAISFTAEYDIHPGSIPKFTQKCCIYVKDRKHFMGESFAECFAQL